MEQRRELVTAIPGPASQALMQRKSSAVAQGVGTTMPVFAAEAGGAVLKDVDGNTLIDFGSGIAVTSVGNSAPRVVAAVQEQVSGFGPFAPEVYRAPVSYPYRDDKNMDGELAAKRAIAIIEKQVGADNLAAVTGRTEMMDAPHVGGLGGAYGGNPLACAAALAVIETIREGGLVDRAAAIGRTMLDRLHRLQADDDRLGDVRGRGAMVAVELVKVGTSEPDPDLAKSVAAAAHQQGLIVLTCGTFGNVLCFLPPLVMPHDLLEEGLSILEDVFAKSRTSPAV